jgi:DNA-binding MarR family transcriptional regulator
VDAELLLQYFETQRFLFMAEQCLNLAKKCLQPTLRDRRLNHSQYLVLMILRYADLAGEQVIATELASLLARERHTITPLVESLVRRGLIVRRRGQKDRRSISLVLSPRGKALIAEVQPLTMGTVAGLRKATGAGIGDASRFLEQFRRSSAAAAGQNPAVYQGAFERLLLGGEQRLLELMGGSRAARGSRPRSARPRAKGETPCR